MQEIFEYYQFLSADVDLTKFFLSLDGNSNKLDLIGFTNIFFEAKLKLLH